MSIAARLKQARDKADLSVFELSVRAHVPEMTIRRYENGERHRYDFETIAKLARALDINVEELTEGVA